MASTTQRQNRSGGRVTLVARRQLFGRLEQLLEGEDFEHAARPWLRVSDDEGNVVIPRADCGVRQTADAAGIDVVEPAGVGLHDLRHGVATALAARRNPPELKSKMLGRSTVGFTLTTYTHSSDDQMYSVCVVRNG